MTKLLEWLSVLTIMLAIYFPIVTRQIKSDLLEKWMFEIQILPIIAAAIFGVSKINMINRLHFNLLSIVFRLLSVLFGIHDFISCLHIQWLPRSSCRNPRRNCRSKKGFISKRTEKLKQPKRINLMSFQKLYVLQCKIIWLITVNVSF